MKQIPWYRGKTLPPWTGDDDAMLHWLCDRLDEDMWSGPELSKAELRAYLREGKKRQTPNELEIFFARRGDLGPLLKKHPDLEPFLTLPKMERGKSFAQLKAKFSTDRSIFEAALKDVTAICVSGRNILTGLTASATRGPSSGSLPNGGSGTLKASTKPLAVRRLDGR